MYTQSQDTGFWSHTGQYLITVHRLLKRNTRIKGWIFAETVLTALIKVQCIEFAWSSGTRPFSSCEVFKTKLYVLN